MKTIKAKIRKKDGVVALETSGYTGDECLKATAKLEEGLGIQHPDRQLKPEFYEQSGGTTQDVGGAG